MASSLAQTSEPKDDGVVSMDIDDGNDDSPLLVSEFPPPPYYYTLAANTTKEQSSLQPPEIPTEALQRAARNAASMAAEAKEIADRNRLQAGNLDLSNNSQNHDDNKTSALGGTAPNLKSTLDDEGEVVAVFGEIVEDPLLVQVEDDCEDPTKVRDTVSRLNNQVLQGFAKLVSELVYRPLENKHFRDELSHKIFLMIQECNKFREHQARETLIELLEHQLMNRQKALKQLEEQIKLADESIEQCKRYSLKKTLS